MYRGSTPRCSMLGLLLAGSWGLRTRVLRIPGAVRGIARASRSTPSVSRRVAANEGIPPTHAKISREDYKSRHLRGVSSPKTCEWPEGSISYDFFAMNRSSHTRGRMLPLHTYLLLLFLWLFLNLRPSLPVMSECQKTMACNGLNCILC